VENELVLKTDLYWTVLGYFSGYFSGYENFGMSNFLGKLRQIFGRILGLIRIFELRT